MSIKTWKKEFYPVPASKVSKKNAVAHSLKKWEGLLIKNLKKHEVESGFGCVIDPAVEDDFSEEYEFIFDDTNCALCVHYMNKTSCEDCPLFKVCGEACGDSPKAPFDIYLDDNDPMPMIKALKKCLTLEKKGK